MRLIATFYTTFVMLASLISTGTLAQSNTLNLERLYSLPSLIGTAPTDSAWSADSQKLAWLWNDKGYSFKDIWITNSQSAKPHAITSLGSHHQHEEHNLGISSVVWYPQGTHLLYSLGGDLYRLDEQGKNSQRLTKTGAIESQIRFSPDGNYFSFVRKGELWLQAATITNSSTSSKLTELAQSDMGIEHYQWSPDADKLLIIVRDDRQVPRQKIAYYLKGEAKQREVIRPFPGDITAARRVGIMTVQNKTIHWLQHPKHHPIWSYGWSYDSKRVLIDSSDFLIKKRNIQTYTLTDNQAQLFYQELDGHKVSPDWSAAWVPKDQGLIILSDRDGFYHLYHLALAQGKMRQLTQGQWEIESFKIDAQRQQIYFVANRDHNEQRQLYRMAITGGPIEQISHRAGTHSPVFSPDFQHLADHFSSDSTPADLYLLSTNARQSRRRMTHSPLPEFSQYAWAEAKYIQFNSHIDNETLTGRLTLPVDFNAKQTYPLIVGSVYANSVRNQWGGRTAHPTWGLDQLLVAKGYILLNVNVRGSWGQGKRFRQKLFQDYGGIDIEDLHSGVQYLIKQGYVDAKRVGIWGSSYGGLMTLMSLFKKPGVYAAGIAGAPASNVYHAYPEQMWVMMRPADNGDKFRRSSALFQSAGLVDPLMIIHGSADQVVLYRDSLALTQDLIANQQLFELVTLPGSGHAWDNENLAQTRFAFKKMIAFFNRYLAIEQ